MYLFLRWSPKIRLDEAFTAFRGEISRRELFLDVKGRAKRSTIITYGSAECRCREKVEWIWSQRRYCMEHGHEMSGDWRTPIKGAMEITRFALLSAMWSRDRVFRCLVPERSEESMFTRVSGSTYIAGRMNVHVVYRQVFAVSWHECRDARTLLEGVFTPGTAEARRGRKYGADNEDRQ